MPKRLKPTPQAELERRARAYLKEWGEADTSANVARLVAYLKKVDLSTRRMIESVLNKPEKPG